MIGTLISHARKRGTFKNSSGKIIDYDNIVLYVATPLYPYKRDGCELSGNPVSLVEVKIPANKFSTITNLPDFDGSVSDRYFESIQLYYDLGVVNGEQRAVLNHVEF